MRNIGLIIAILGCGFLLGVAFGLADPKVLGHWYDWLFPVVVGGRFTAPGTGV